MTIEFSVNASGFALTIGTPHEVACKPGKYYVYIHRGNGSVFYVGKGTGYRAYSKDRQPEWHYWVEKVLNNNYSVEIVVKGISEEDAIRLEDDLLREHAYTVINLQTMHAPYDTEKFLLYSDLIGLYSRCYKEGMKLQKAGHLEKAISCYYTAYEHYVQAMQNSDYELGARSLLPRPRYAPTQLSDSLSKCLVKQGRLSEVVKLYTEFVTAFGEGQTIIEAALKKRAENAAKKVRP